MAQLCFWNKIRTQHVSAFQCLRVGFLCPKCNNFPCLHTRQYQNELHLKKWFFFLPKSASSVSRSQAQLAKRKCIGWLIGFNSKVFAKFVAMVSPKCSIVENDNEVMLMALHTHYSRVYELFLTFHALVANFFHIFHKITNIRSWRCFSSFKIRTQFSHTFLNIAMILKVISQYSRALSKLIHNHICSAEG